MAQPRFPGEIQNAILQWAETSISSGDFDATAFLFRGKEFGHIHTNSDLDMLFGM